MPRWLRLKLLKIKLKELGSNLGHLGPFLFLVFVVKVGVQLLRGVENKMLRLELMASLELWEVRRRPEVVGPRALGHLGDPPQLQPELVVRITLSGLEDVVERRQVDVQRQTVAPEHGPDAQHPRRQNCVTVVALPARFRFTFGGLSGAQDQRRLSQGQDYEPHS